LIAALQQLSEVDRAALLMRSLEDLPYESIAAALGLTTVAVRVKVHRARMKLHELRTRRPDLPPSPVASADSP
jgi:RNA polymerase sigma-70 factor (ECF subfamily)